MYIGIEKRSRQVNPKNRSPVGKAMNTTCAQSISAEAKTSCLGSAAGTQTTVRSTAPSEDPKAIKVLTKGNYTHLVDTPIRITPARKQLMRRGGGWVELWIRVVRVVTTILTRLVNWIPVRGHDLLRISVRAVGVTGGGVLAA